MTNKKIKAQKNYELIIEKLIELINQHILKPGERLASVEQLAIQFNVGRSAIREALSALRVLGYVEIKQGDGTFVSKTNPSVQKLQIPQSNLEQKLEQQAFFEVRKILETGAVKLAALRRSESDLNTIAHILSDMNEATKLNQEEKAEMTDIRFHLAVAEASHNHYVIQLMNQLSTMLHTTMKESRMHWIFTEKSTIERLYHEHVSIYEAIEDKNASLAEALMLSHLGKVEKRSHITN